MAFPKTGSNFMENYVEQRLTTIHNTSEQSVKNYRQKVITFFVGLFIIITLPYIHLGVLHRIIFPGKPKIDRRSCKCSCFDTVFRGSYESPGSSGYKHVYFNVTWQTYRIWIFTVLFILMAYESLKYLVGIISNKSLRKSMFVLFLVNLYPHYYSWWSYFSYYNEDFYDYYTHHMLFTITEIIATCLVLNLSDNQNPIVSWKILAIVSINTMHICIAGMDQFIAHVIRGKGTDFQNVRNIALMVPDLLHVVIPLLELFIHAKQNNKLLRELCFKEEVMLCVVFICLGTLFGKML
ncbi:uncharacterized protein LOC127737749 [Mytilus californianus]|uniref:uncharacterized protein LOC127737749 n=1 Tax=Mytilus californianus TaxID=6549 RepID=UPI002245E26C|nr:uncharacterized protein LOC127737749 [Mytilus californianus]